MDISDEDVASIQSWAASEVLIRAVYVFGSRARGDSSPTSDLDIAIEIKCAPEHVDLWFGMNGPFWQDDLRRRIPLEVNLHHLNGDATPKHSGAVARDGIEIYRSHDTRLYDPGTD